MIATARMINHSRLDDRDEVGVTPEIEAFSFAVELFAESPPPDDVALPLPGHAADVEVDETGRPSSAARIAARPSAESCTPWVMQWIVTTVTSGE